jgi:hypothetical protein
MKGDLYSVIPKGFVNEDKDNEFEIMLIGDTSNLYFLVKFTAFEDSRFVEKSWRD